MKAITKLAFIFTMSLLTMACATVPANRAERYNFDDELMKVNQIYKFRLKSWQKVDNQSLIVRTDVNDYYLFVLHRPSASLAFSENIGITDSADKIKPGYDNVIVKDSGGRESFIIQKIYKFKDRKQAMEIKKRLR
jgi:hypothetical protein